MSDPFLGLLMLVLSVIAIMLGFPTAFTLMGLGMVFGFIAFWAPNQAWYDNHVFDLMVQRTYGVMNNDTLLSVPLFVFMGYIMERAALVDRMFHSVQLAFRRVPASLAVTTLLVCAFWGIASGIVGAVVVLMGVIAMRPMLRAGYDVRLASGAITAGGTLGILIPPSVMLIVYAAVAGVSIVRLYAAAMLPGLFLTFLYLVYILGWAIIDPKIAPKLPASEYKVTVPPWIARLQERPGGSVLGGLFALLFAPRRQKGGTVSAPSYSSILRALGVAVVPLALTLLTFAGSWWYVVIHSATPSVTASVPAERVRAEALNPTPQLAAEPEAPQELGLGDVEPLEPAANEVAEPNQPEELGGATESEVAEAAAPVALEAPQELGVASAEDGAQDAPQELGLAEPSGDTAAEATAPEELGLASPEGSSSAEAAAPEELGVAANDDRGADVANGAPSSTSAHAAALATAGGGTAHVPAGFFTGFWLLAAGAALLLALYYVGMDGERLQILKELIVSVLPLGVLTLVVLAVILFGITTATESAAIGALSALYLAVMSKHPGDVWRWTLAGALAGVAIGVWRGGNALNVFVSACLVGVFAGTVGPWQKSLKSSRALWRVLKEPTFLTAKTTAMVCWLFVGSALFSAVFALHGGQALIERWVLGMNLSPLGFLAVSQLIIFVLGWPLEWTEIIVIFCPIFIPLLGHFKVDPILFGTMVAVNLQAAFLSPPVAMSAFYLKGVSPPQVELRQIFAGMMPYMFIVLLCLVFMYVWPGMSLWLPDFLYGS